MVPVISRSSVPALILSSPVCSRALDSVSIQTLRRLQRTVSVGSRQPLKRQPTRFSPPSKNGGCFQGICFGTNEHGIFSILIITTKLDTEIIGRVGPTFIY